jgi:hypothetical protein
LFEEARCERVGLSGRREPKFDGIEPIPAITFAGPKTLGPLNNTIAHDMERIEDGSEWNDAFKDQVEAKDRKIVLWRDVSVDADRLCKRLLELVAPEQSHMTATDRPRAVAPGAAAKRKLQVRLAEAKHENWYEKRVSNWGDSSGPTADDDLKEIRKAFPESPLTRDALRALRRKLAPKTWTKQGRRKTAI